MRIVQITPGSGDSFYCENCLRDIALVRQMRKLGHDVLMVPMYLPFQGAEAEEIANAPIFFGGINVFLQQKSALFRKTPRWIDQLFDSPRLLKWISRKADMTTARALGETTISMLQGVQGRQVKELERLIKWLDDPKNKPDIVCLSNVLLAGLAKPIREKLGVPVLSLLEDEDAFLDGLGQPYAPQAWKTLADCSNYIDGFIAVSKYYAEVMQQRLNISDDKMHVVYAGIELSDYDPVESMPTKPTIGYLSRMCPDKGLDTLADAFIILKRDQKLVDAKLRVAGGGIGNDQAFINKTKEKMRACGFGRDVEFLPNLNQNFKIAFLKSLSVLSVPEKKPAAGALYILESLATGVPVVTPALGGCGEITRITAGGLLYQPGNTEPLIAALKKILTDPDYAFELGRRGREAVSLKFNIEQTAKETVRIYENTMRLNQ